MVSTMASLFPYLLSQLLKLHCFIVNALASTKHQPVPQHSKPQQPSPTIRTPAAIGFLLAFAGLLFSFLSKSFSLSRHVCHSSVSLVRTVSSTLHTLHRLVRSFFLRLLRVSIIYLIFGGELVFTVTVYAVFLTFSLLLFLL